MSDRDALAREMGWDVVTHINIMDAANIATRHIEAARAEERERCARICMDLPARHSAHSAAGLIRAGSPAPAERNEESDEFSGSMWSDEWGKE